MYLQYVLPIQHNRYFSAIFRQNIRQRVLISDVCGGEEVLAGHPMR